MRRIWFKLRLWKWLLSAPRWPIETLYLGAAKLDHDSRWLIINRIEKEWKCREPRENSGGAL